MCHTGVSSEGPPHSVASYDMQGDVGGSILTRILTGIISSVFVIFLQNLLVADSAGGGGSCWGPILSASSSPFLHCTVQKIGRWPVAYRKKVDWVTTNCFTSRSKIGLWADRDLYCATPTVTRGLGFSGFIRMTASFSRLLRHARGYGGFIITRITPILTDNRKVTVQFLVAITKINLQTAVLVDVDNKEKPSLKQKGLTHQ
jgi:hypothetical protein